MFFIGYESIKKSIYFPDVQIAERSYSRLFLVLLPLLVMIWTGRSVLLSSGSYYHIYRTDYQFTSPFYSVFAQLSGYGLIIAGALFLIAFSEKQKRHKKIKFTLAITIFLLEMLWLVPSGSREPIAHIILAALLAYTIIKRTIPVKTVVFLAIMSIPLLAAFGGYRNVVSSYSEVSELNLTKTLPALIETKERLDIQNIDILTTTLDRIYDGKSLGYILTHYSNDYDYELGYTYLKIPFIFIPRFIYSDKPVFTTPLNNWYILLGGGSMPITFWGESYINFSWVGILIMSFLLGITMKGFDYLFIQRVHKPYWMYIYIFSSIHIIRLPMQAAVIWLSFLIKAILLAVILTGIHSVLTKTIRPSQDASAPRVIS